MPLSVEDILKICTFVAQNESLLATGGDLLKTGADALGNLFGGPIGTFLGGTFGSQAGGPSFISVIPIINKMTSAQQQQLAERIGRYLQSIGPQDLILLVPIILSSTSYQSAILKIIIHFITIDMGMAI